ncbi:hypothetical protein [Actinomyces ruminis]|uniref:hypothetical protein n=1 Tax=Actinomyces ruminis TaxID=1937003 RepID=UPI001177CB72|nr:hypothetical protein [Actinomyces ruminis]
MALLLPGVHLLWASVLTYVVVIDLVAHGTHYAAVAIFLIFYAAQIPWADGAPDLINTMALWAFICGGTGILLKWLRNRMESLIRDANASREAFDVLNQQLRNDIADALHNDLASDLTHMILHARELRNDAPDQYANVAAVEAEARQALSHLRALIDSLGTSGPYMFEESSVEDVIATSRTALAHRSMLLDADLDKTIHLLPQYGADAGRLLAALVRECTLNALKYNNDGDLLSLIVERPVSVCRSLSPPPGATSNSRMSCTAGMVCVD